METPLNFAVMGPGKIAHSMAKTVAALGCVRPYAVGSRSLDRAETFAAQYGYEKAYEELVGDPNVDLIYIATPHSCHYEEMKLCIGAGKAVLCEKAFTVNAKEAREVLALAEKKGVLVTEAIWPRYMPMAETLREFMAGGEIGEIFALTANLGYPVYARERIRKPELAGGALLDVTIYPLTFASLLFGDEVESCEASAVFGETGVDVTDSVTLHDKNGRTAQLLGSVVCSTDLNGWIYGSKGFACVRNVNNFEALEVYDADGNLLRTVRRPAQITGYEYEVEAAVEAIRRGAAECPQAPHTETIRMMELMDRIREQIGLRYPME